MFANFIYFIIALLILTLYQPKEKLEFSFFQAGFFFVLLTALFAFFTRYQFKRLLIKSSTGSLHTQDNWFTLLLTRHSILALIFFAVSIWVLHLPAYLDATGLFADFPTVSTLLFLFIFVGHLVIVWYIAYDAHRAIYQSNISRKEYVYSNLAFNIPILIPWALLSAITDIIQVLPFEWPRYLLNHKLGQLGLFLVFLFVTATLAPELITRFWRCRPLEPGPERTRIESICKRADVRYANIVYWPIFGGRMITAGVMGVVSRFRYILVTDALLRMLHPDEVDQVIAHEIGHVKRKHLLLYILFFIGFMFTWYPLFLVSAAIIKFISPWILALGLPIMIVSYGVQAVVLILGVVIYFRYIFGYFMRNFERQADLYVFDLFPSIQPLINTFYKIVASSGQPADKPNWHHFSIQQRVDYLRQSQASPSWIKRHNNKVKKSLIAYVFVMLIASPVFFYFSWTYLSENQVYSDVDITAQVETYLNTKTDLVMQDSKYAFYLGQYYALKKNYILAGKYYELGLKLNPDILSRNGEIYLILGNIYFEANHHRKAVYAWEQALKLFPDNAEIMNSLAWVLAITEDQKIADPVRALELVSKAVNLKRASHILDTYAEALYLNGRIEEAIKIEEEAIELDPKNMLIFKKQLIKFQKAASTKNK
ncbi:MAG: tetratricopeptide repeat protein [Desulfobacteraceae bacterium]|nr:tetratricopeptide repeat protein [Desulfobacteraceae bacterium]